MSHFGCNNCHCSIQDHDPSLNLRPQKPRTTFTKEQLTLLEQIFEDSNYPSAEKRQMLAKVLEMPDERVRIWFQNRRAKEKRLAEEKLAMSLLPKKKETSKIYHQLDKGEINHQPLSIPTFFAQQPFHVPLNKMLHTQWPQFDAGVQLQVPTENTDKSEEDVVRYLLKRAKEREQGKNEAHLKGQRGRRR